MKIVGQYKLDQEESVEMSNFISKNYYFTLFIVFICGVILMLIIYLIMGGGV